MIKQKLVFSLIIGLLLTSCHAHTSSSFATSNEVDVTSQSTCEHDFVLVNENRQEPTIIEKKVSTYKCSKCEEIKEEYAYDLKECSFEDQTFMEDGRPRQLFIQGLLPYGTTVEYENNSLTEIGTKEVTAKILDEKKNVLEVKKAKLSVVENTRMPNIRIDTNNTEITSKEEYVSMKLSTDNCDEAFIKNDAPGEIRCRGNGTMTYDKKAYRIKFSGKTNMFGLNNGLKAKSWVLLAEYADQSMVRNATAFYLGNQLFKHSNNYASDYLPVNVYLNGKYNGVYLLAEQQQANKGRVNVNEADDNYTGVDVGYLLELDYYATEEDYYFSVGKGGNNWGFPGGQQTNGDKLDGVTLPRKDYTIKTDVYSDEQVNYIKNYLTNVYYAFYHAVSENKLEVLNENNELVASPYKSQYETLNSFIDLESVFKMYLLHELMKSVDVGYSSFYMFVDFSKNSLYPRLTFGAPWDFDWSSGNVKEEAQIGTSGAYNSTSFKNFNPWFFMLSRTDFFNDMIKKYYRVFTDSNLLAGAIAQSNYYAAAFKDDYADNYAKWQNLGQVTPKYTPDLVKKFKSHQDAVDYLNNWLVERNTALSQLFKETKE